MPTKPRPGSASAIRSHSRSVLPRSIRWPSRFPTCESTRVALPRQCCPKGEGPVSQAPWERLNSKYPIAVNWCAAQAILQTASWAETATEYAVLRVRRVSDAQSNSTGYPSLAIAVAIQWPVCAQTRARIPISLITGQLRLCAIAVTNDPIPLVLQSASLEGRRIPRYVRP